MADSAQSSKLRINLNLLHPRETPAKLPERFLKWLITYGRFIVIFVEIIVVSAFLARFKFDADLDTLKNQIKRDLPYVEGLALDEALIRQTQTKLNFIGKTYSDSDQWQETVVELSSLMPESITLTGLGLDQDGENKTAVNFRLTGSTLSNADLGAFLNNLRQQKDLGGISLASISFDSSEILFTITGYKSKT